MYIANFILHLSETAIMDAKKTLACPDMIMNARSFCSIEQQNQYLDLFETQQFTLKEEDSDLWQPQLLFISHYKRRQGALALIEAEKIVRNPETRR